MYDREHCELHLQGTLDNRNVVVWRGPRVRMAEIVDRILATIRTHYAEPISLRQLADSVGRHPHYVGQLFRQRMGVTVHSYLTQCRLESAVDLIMRGEKIEAVSMCVGYRSKRTFYRRFKRHFGVTPREYRLACRDKRASVNE